MGRLILHGAALGGCLAGGLLGADAAGLEPVAGTLAAALLYLGLRVLGRRLTDAFGRRRVAARAGLRGGKGRRLRSALELLDRGHPDVARAALASMAGAGPPVPVVMATWARACLRLSTHRGFGLGSADAWAGVSAGRRRPLPRLERALLAPSFPTEDAPLAAEAAGADDASIAAILGVRSLLVGTLLPAVGNPLHPLFPRAEQDLERILGARYMLFPRLRLERRARSLQPGALLPPREEAALLLLVHGRAAAAAALLASADDAGSLTRRGRALRSASLLLEFLRDGGEVAVTPELLARRTREIFFLHTRSFAMTDGSPHLEALPEGPLRLLRLLEEKRRLVTCLALLRLGRPGMSRRRGGLARRIAAGGDGSAAPRGARRFLRWWRREGRAIDRAAAFNLRGLLLIGEGRSAESVAEFEAARALDPDLDAAAYNHAVALHESGADGDCAAPLREYADRAGDEVRAGLLLGEFLERTDRPEEAEREYRRLLDLDPACGEAAHALGRLLLEEGNAAEALEPLRRALAARAGDPGVLVTLGLAHLAAGRPAEAAPLFRAAVEAAEGDRREEARFLLHVAFRDAEDHLKALETLDAVPDRFLRRNEPMMEEAALYLEERSRWDRARRLHDRLRELRARRGEL